MTTEPLDARRASALLSAPYYVAWHHFEIRADSLLLAAALQCGDRRVLDKSLRRYLIGRLGETRWDFRRILRSLSKNSFPLSPARSATIATMTSWKSPSAKTISRDKKSWRLARLRDSARSTQMNSMRQGDYR
jgi:hypothetical protein